MPGRYTVNLRGQYKMDKNWTFTAGYVWEKYTYSDTAYDGYSTRSPRRLGRPPISPARMPTERDDEHAVPLGPTVLGHGAFQPRRAGDARPFYLTFDLAQLPDSAALLHYAP